MKRAFTYIIVINLLLSLFTPIDYSLAMANDFSDTDQVQKIGLSDKFLPPSENWVQNMAGEIPATFSTVKYEFQDDIIELGEDISKSIASRAMIISGSTIQKILPKRIVAQGGYIPIDVLDGAAAKVGQKIEIGSIVVDKDSRTAFKVLAPITFQGLPDPGEDMDGLDELIQVTAAFEGNYGVTMPQLHEVLKEFSFGGSGEDGETIELTKGNITGFAPNVEKNFYSPTNFEFIKLEDEYTGFKYIEDKFASFRFDNEKLDAFMEDGSKINVTVNGGIGIGKMKLTGKYSGFDGYKIALSMDEESYLHVDMKANLDEEIKIPIIGIGVDLGVGSISGGVFIVVGVDGAIRLEIGAREYVKASMGVKGSTRLYIPTSVKPLFGLDKLEGEGDLAMTGPIKGYLKFGPEVGIDIFGFDIAGASLYLGTGANVSSDNLLLDVELYGILDANAKFAGKRLSLVNQRPTILKRKQANTGSFLISFIEVFIEPSRVGGIIKKQDADPDKEDKPAKGIKYRILVVAENKSIDLNNLASIDEPYVRKYPQTGYKETNEEGEFIYEDLSASMLYNGDKVYLEIIDEKGDKDKTNDERFISAPQSPILPFEKMKIYKADAFNDYMKGQIMPIRVINWDATPQDPPEDQYETRYYGNLPVTIKNYTYEAAEGGEKAVVISDEKGNFDTRINIPAGIVNDLNIKLPPTYAFCRNYSISIESKGCQVTSTQWCIPEVTIICNRVIEEVDDSFVKREENGKIIDSMKFREYIWFVNPYGTRTISNEEIFIDTWGISSVDSPSRGSSLNPNYEGTDLGGTNPVTVSEASSPGLTAILDKNGNETGASVLAREIIAEWVWQEHKNPVKITSSDNYNCTRDGGSFLVTASGYKPFLFSLENEPAGVRFKIGTGDKISMTIPPGLQEGEYKFTIRAEEDRSRTHKDISELFNLAENDYYEGNDPSPPDEQLFTLTISKGLAVIEEEGVEPENPEEAKPAEEIRPPKESEDLEEPEETNPPEEVEPPAEIGFAPLIDEEKHDYKFSKVDNDKSFTIDVDARGSTPIKWYLMPTRPYALNEGLSIDNKSGLLTVDGEMEEGNYYFTIKAENDFGFDTQTCQLAITKPLRIAPIISTENHGYAFSRTASGRDLEVQIRASGSTPIEWSLIRTEGYRIPEGINIDKDTGLLTLYGTMTRGNYYFTIKAENDVGSDTQECSLEIKASINISNTTKQDLKLLSSFSPVEDSSKASLYNDNQAEISLEKQEMPSIAYTITINCDDERDFYSNDRFNINGAKYIRWEPSFSTYVDDILIKDYMLDNAPWCLKYHYKDSFIAHDSAEKIEQIIKELSKETYDEDFGLGMFSGGMISRQDLESEFDEKIVNPIEEQASYLDYASLIEEINSRKIGNFLVELDKNTGATVPGEYFTALMDNPDASISFNQEGAMIKFAGKDVLSVSQYDSFNLKYFSEAVHKDEILEQIGNGGENFTFAFFHHGELPGMASFSIDTNISDGTSVNVYRYDTEEGQFILIGEKVMTEAGGLVTYRNNTMSEYLITSKTLENAVISESVKLQGGANKGKKLLLGMAVGIALVLVAAAAFVFAKNKKHTEK